MSDDEWTLVTSKKKSREQRKLQAAERTKKQEFQQELQRQIDTFRILDIFQNTRVSRVLVHDDEAKQSPIVPLQVFCAERERDVQRALSNYMQMMPTVLIQLIVNLAIDWETRDEYLPWLKHVTRDMVFYSESVIAFDDEFFDYHPFYDDIDDDAHSQKERLLTSYYKFQVKCREDDEDFEDDQGRLSEEDKLRVEHCFLNHEYGRFACLTQKNGKTVPLTIEKMFTTPRASSNYFTNETENNYYSSVKVIVLQPKKGIALIWQSGTHGETTVGTFEDNGTLHVDKTQRTIFGELVITPSCGHRPKGASLPYWATTYRKEECADLVDKIARDRCRNSLSRLFVSRTPGKLCYSCLSWNQTEPSMRMSFNTALNRFKDNAKLGFIKEVFEFF